MPGRMSDADVRLILNNRFGGATATVQSVHHLGLSTTMPATDGTGVTEPAIGATTNYGRVSITNNAVNWPSLVAPPAGQPGVRGPKVNGSAFTFGTAATDWGLIVAFVLFSAATGGVLNAFGPLLDADGNPITVPVPAGATPSFPAGSIVIASPGNV